MPDQYLQAIDIYFIEVYIQIKKIKLNFEKDQHSLCKPFEDFFFFNGSVDLHEMTLGTGSEF